MKTDDILRAPCNSCGTVAKHRVIWTHENLVFPGHDDPSGGPDECDETDDPPVYTDHYSLLECCGCAAICLRYDSTFEYTEHPQTETVYYPPRLSRRHPVWLKDLPEHLQGLVREVYAALAVDNRRLAAMGARAIIDVVALDRVGDIGTFSAKLKTLQEHGAIGQVQREHLEAALDTGSAAVHRAFEPSERMLSNTMDIVEHLLQAIFILPAAAEELKRGTPPRKHGGEPSTAV